MNRVLAVLTPAALSLALLAGCGKKEADSGMMTDGAPSAGMPASAVTPAPATQPVPGTTGTGPSEGSTAIGGMTGDRSTSGGANQSGSQSAPTAGDGAVPSRP